MKNMKKGILLLCVFCMALVFTSCGKPMSKEELLKSSETVDVYKLHNAADKKDYCKKPIRTQAYVFSVEKDHAVLGCSVGPNAQVYIAAYLPEEELKTVQPDTVIEIAGIASEVKSMDVTTEGITVSYPHYIMKTVYLTTEAPEEVETSEVPEVSEEKN
ncbi:MAG: hypothetical protein MSD68_15985 [Blautia sp.]|uniref:hypothetical protein n=1 Tax=Blautia sp. TaxID=1955243 RepID=UPI0025C0FA38|nr:hypothetical protein [Blautia sp.]MCI7451157.1 hypothetical protein [Blautia sp.]